MQQLLTIGLGLLLVGPTDPQRTAVPGERVPDIANSHWISGEPVEQFESGRVYVLEFWSTWCSACIASIEHLNDLAQKYEADASFIAIHIWQRDGAPTPAQFQQARRKAEKPAWDFAVVEDKDDALARAWMDATDNGGFPTTMIVDRDAKLAWFGHTKDLDAPLAAIVNGTFDMKRGVFEMTRRIRVGRKSTQASKAIETGNFGRGMTLMLESLREDPDTVREWIPSTFGHLLHASQSPGIAAQFARKVIATKEGNSVRVLLGFARIAVGFQPASLADPQFALEMANRANALENSTNPVALSTLSMVHAKLHDVPSAISAIELAITHARSADDRLKYQRTLETLRQQHRNKID